MSIVQMDDYIKLVERVFADHAELREDILKVADYLAAKGGEEVGITEIRDVITDMKRTIPVLAFIAGGSSPLVDMFYKVKISDGTLHDAGPVTKAQTDGVEPYFYPETGERVEELAKNLYPVFMVNGFEPTHEQARTPTC